MSKCRGFAAQRRTEREVSPGDVVDGERSFFLDRLAEQAVAGRDLDRRKRVVRHAVRRHAQESGAVARVKRGRCRFQVFAEKTEQAVAHLLQRLAAGHQLAQLDLTGLNPFLPRAGIRRLTQQVSHGRREQETERAGHNCRRDGPFVGQLHLVHAPHPGRPFGSHHAIDFRSNFIHGSLAAVRHDFLLGCGKPFLAAEGDGLVQFVKFGGNRARRAGR